MGRRQALDLLPDHVLAHVGQQRALRPCSRDPAQRALEVAVDRVLGHVLAIDDPEVDPGHHLEAAVVEVLQIRRIGQRAAVRVEAEAQRLHHHVVLGERRDRQRTDLERRRGDHRRQQGRRVPAVARVVGLEGIAEAPLQLVEGRGVGIGRDRAVHDAADPAQVVDAVAMVGMGDGCSRRHPGARCRGAGAAGAGPATCRPAPACRRARPGSTNACGGCADRRACRSG